MSHEHLEKLVAGSYCYVNSNHSKKYVQKVAKVTATQIITHSMSWHKNAEGFGETRFRRDSGREKGQDSWHASYIVVGEPTQAEIEAFDKGVIASEKHRELQRRLKLAEERIAGDVVMKTGLPLEVVKVSYVKSEDNGVTWSFKVRIEYEVPNVAIN